MIRCIDKRLKRLAQLRRDERASALTEFTFFLPVWVLLFIGIVNLGKIGWGTTRTQIQAQIGIWKQLGPMVDYDLEKPEHIHFAAAAADAGLVGGTNAKLYRPRANFVGTNQAANSFEGGTWAVAMGASGHWGESYQRTKVLEGASLAQLSEGPHMKPDDLFGNNKTKFPASIVNDTLTEVSKPSGGVASIIGSLITSSGALPAVGAGQRYGVIVSEVVDDQISVAGGWSTISSNSRYDALVPPAAMTGFTADRVPFALARLMAESQENYKVMLDWGETGWTNQSPGDFEFNEDPKGEGEDKGEDQAKQQCKDAGFGSNESRCKSCKDRGFQTASACDCADDPDCPAPPPP